MDINNSVNNWYVRYCSYTLLLKAVHSYVFLDNIAAIRRITISH